MNILLIKPRWFVEGGVYRFLQGIRFTPLHLGILAALSDGHNVKVVDGDWDEIPYDDPFDLVGITVTTFTSQAAYRIADRFRQKGAKVVMGGVHPSILPEEALEHADAVVVGEAEYVWKDVLKDAESSTLQKQYRGPGPVAMDDVPFPRRGLVNESSWFACVQATRGCPNSCRYCYLPHVPWARYRKRDVGLVYEELAMCRQKVIFFVDDNLFADRKYALDLCKRIAPLKKVWSIQAPTKIAGDREVLDAMAQSGCFNVQVGFQTFNPNSLEWARVKNRAGEYEQQVKAFHDCGMLVGGFFIFGFDQDDETVFARTTEMIKGIDLDDAHLYVLTPYPGTDFYDELKEQGRLLEDSDRSKYGWSNAVFQPMNMSVGELEQGVERTYRELHGFFRKKLPLIILKRLPWLIRNPALLKAMVSGGLRKASIQQGLLPG